MRAAIENGLLRHWYSNSQPPWYLRMLEPVYRAAYQHRQKKALTKSEMYHAKLPLLVVGNITAGGSGKTPLVIRLCEIALEMGLKPGIASTGYGRQSGETLVVRADSEPRLCGDEPVMLALRTGVPVVVASNRTAAVKKLEEMNLDIIFSDDGLQQADLFREIEICVVDGERGLGNGHLIPAGPLREPAARLGQVDHVVSNGQWAGKPDNVEVKVMHLQASTVCSLDGKRQYPVDEFRQNHAGTRLQAVAGIGNPGRFFRMLERLGISADSKVFPDHHFFTSGDFDSLVGGSAIIMTEKDAVKCRSLELDNAWFVPVDTLLPTEFELGLKDQIANLTKDNL
jgi:tetraacyldisaccharide 4'-kinase